MNKFWNVVKDTTIDSNGEEREATIVRIDGPIDEDVFWGDEISPSAFREEIDQIDGDLEVWINSPGGNVFAAAQIYNILMERKGHVRVMVDAIAASAASVIAMAGTDVFISPTGMMMIHDPMTIAMGNAQDMEKAIATLNEVKESIINAYQLKTGLSRAKIAKLMEDETWMNAKRAVELGFADKIAYTESGKDTAARASDFSAKHCMAAITNKLTAPFKAEAVVEQAEQDKPDAQSEPVSEPENIHAPEMETAPEPENTIDAKQYYDRLENIKNAFVKGE